jgi:predicted Zn finger-like uncharacterized protein
MHVICSNCGARYIVDPLAIGPTGRTVQCARCNHRWFERAGPASAAVLHERLEQPEYDTQDAGERPQSQGQPQPAYRSGLPAIARPQVRRPRWPYVIAAVVLLAVALGAVLVFRGDVGTKSPMPWRATGLSLGLSPGPAVATAEAGRTGATSFSHDGDCLAEAVTTARCAGVTRTGMPEGGVGEARVDIAPAIE